MNNTFYGTDDSNFHNGIGSWLKGVFNDVREKFDDVKENLEENIECVNDLKSKGMSASQARQTCRANRERERAEQENKDKFIANRTKELVKQGMTPEQAIQLATKNYEAKLFLASKGVRSKVGKGIGQRIGSSIQASKNTQSENTTNSKRVSKSVDEEVGTSTVIPGEVVDGSVVEAKPEINYMRYAGIGAIVLVIGYGVFRYLKTRKK